VKIDNSKELSPISSPTSYYRENYEFSSCESGDEESEKDVLTDLNGVEKYKDEKYKSISLSKIRILFSVSYTLFDTLLSELGEHFCFLAGVSSVSE
jgi:hypothetical protein